MFSAGYNICTSHIATLFKETLRYIKLVLVKRHCAPVLNITTKNGVIAPKTEVIYSRTTFHTYMKADDKIYLAYFESKKPELYFNELKELTGLSDSSLANTLKQLVNQNILKMIKTKSNTFYKIQNRKLFSLKFSEIAISKFDSLNRGVKIPLQNLLKLVSRDIYSIVLFGSTSRKQEKKGSDIDILIILNNQYDFSKIKKEIDSTSNYPLNIFSCTKEDFEKKRDHIILQAKKTGFPIKGEQYFYEVQLDETLRIL